MKQNDEAAILAEQRAELTAYRTILQNLLLEVARETGAEKLNAIREASLGAIAELAAPESELTRHQSAAIVHQCFDTVAAQAGFTIRTPARDVH
jgi:hypothetical protein